MYDLVFFSNRLEEAEEKYRSRQSRPEDLEVIEQLKRVLAERELDMKKLVVSTLVKLCHSTGLRKKFELQLVLWESSFHILLAAHLVYRGTCHAQGASTL